MARQIIRESGLWNVAHVDGAFDPRSFAAFARWLRKADSEIDGYPKGLQ